MKYKLKDISVIIPTMNRQKDIIETLQPIPDTIKEIIIVNQGCKLNLTHVNKSLPIKIIESSPPAITIARNKGLQYATGKLICYLDDDVTLHPKHFENMIETVNNNPIAEGFAAWRYFEITDKDILLDNIKKVFGFDQFFEKTAELRAPYQNTYPYNPPAEANASWFPGMNMMFKKEVFDVRGMRFDENLLGYTIAEDIDFTYSLYKKNPRALIITSKCPILHRSSQASRSDPKKLMYINQVDHLYFAMKHNMLGRWWWNIFGLCLLRAGAMFHPKQTRKSLYFFQSLVYCFGHWNKIKHGKLREWEKN